MEKVKKANAKDKANRLAELKARPFNDLSKSEQKELATLSIKPETQTDFKVVAPGKSLLDRLNATNLKEKVKKEKNVIYKFQLNDKLDAEEQKKKRSSIRRRLDKLVNNILLFAKYPEKAGYTEKKELEVAAFKAFFAEHYVSEELNLNAIYQGGEDAKQELYQLAIDLVLA